MLVLTINFLGGMGLSKIEADTLAFSVIDLTWEVGELNCIEHWDILLLLTKLFILTERAGNGQEVRSRIEDDLNWILILSDQDCSNVSVSFFIGKSNSETSLRYGWTRLLSKPFLFLFNPYFLFLLFK
jgi:hypothetical protein